MRTLLLIFIFLIALPQAALAQDVDPTVETGETDETAPTTDDSEADETGGIATDETVLWDISGDGDLAGFRAGVKEALAADAAKHLLSEETFRAWLKESSALVPKCYSGVEDCISPGAIVFDTLGISTLLRVEVSPKGAAWAIVDGRGQVVREGAVAEPDIRKRAFGVVAEIFDATGVVTIGSEPPGATVEIDGRSVGTTPLTYRVGVGQHTYRLRMQDHAVTEGNLEVASGRATSIREVLKKLPGTLTVVDAPEGAEIYVNGNLAGRAGEPISLQPGNYTLEVRAEGYEAMSDAFTVEPGLETTRSAPLRQDNLFLRDISSEAIVYNNYILRLGFEYGIHQANFQDARSNDDFPVEFLGLENDDGQFQTGFQRTLGTTGLRVDAAYGLKNFAIVLVSLSYLSTSLKLDGVADVPGVGQVDATITRVRKLQVRPFQVFYRHFYKNFVPFLEAGIGINFQWMQVEGASFSGSETLRRTDALWTIAVGAQYYFTENLFGMLRYSYQDYFENGLGADHQISLGVGAAFPNLFGLDTEPPEQL